MSAMQRSRAALAAILAAAALHATVYVVHERPEWTTAWTDQGGYRLLAEGLRQGGGFTRYPGVAPFVPEALRTPGYPLFVAAIFTLFGSHQLAVVLVQGGLFVTLCLLVYAIARLAADESVALTAAAITAAYSPLPFFAALLLTELWTTFVVTVAILCLVQALRRRSIAWGSAAGFSFAYSALSRPAFLLLAPFLLGTAVLLAPRRQLARAGVWGSLGVVFALTMAPWFAYTHRHFGGFTIAPAGGVGRAIWEGSWQGRWPGRVQKTLTLAADTPDSDDTLDTHVRELAAANRLDAAPMLEYVHQWREIRAIWVTPEEPRERVDARVRADAEYRRAGIANIRRNPLDYLRRRIVRSMPILWAGELPLRQSVVDGLPTWAIRAIWLPQALLCLAAAGGALAVYRAGQLDSLIALAGPIVYVTAVHFVFLTEARQSLPAKPALIVLSAIGIHQLLRRSAASTASTSAPTV
jgi:4-amino-4-deoxy-L-arabinose transferase-like glycosyltransferase